MIIRICIVLPVFSLLACVGAVIVDNSVEGEPEIECGPSSVTVNFNTRNPFEGHVYVKGLYDHEPCKNKKRGRHVAGIELSFDSCNIARTRSLNPRGIFVSSTIVISFHPQFITQVDRAYRIQCFYMEANKTVSEDIQVSDLTTMLHTQNVPLPICSYEILDANPSGAPVQFARIGQTVYHKWTCESETVDTFCAVVHSCTVDDGNGARIEILDEKGCALDKYILDNIQYPGDLVAGQETMVYKYADRSQLFYQCQISIIIKEPMEECPRPECAEPIGFGAREDVSHSIMGITITRESDDLTPRNPRARALLPAGQRVLRKRRSTNFSLFDADHTMDVRYEMTALDLILDETQSVPLHRVDPPSEWDSLLSLPSPSVCLPTPVASLLLFMLLFFIVVTTSLLFVVNRRGRFNEKIPA